MHKTKKYQKKNVELLTQKDLAASFSFNILFLRTAVYSQAWDNFWQLKAF